ncbi:MAG: hypothetical protein JST68_01910 [Bacteroidetes bacterium]|nr:hypothetical protein [Bacteroidota bacterium]
MIDSTKENLEKAKVLRKLMKKWLNTQETQKKADLLLAKNPHLKGRRSASLRKGI